MPLLQGLWTNDGEMFKNIAICWYRVKKASMALTRKKETHRKVIASLKQL